MTVECSSRVVVVDDGDGDQSTAKWYIISASRRQKLMRLMCSAIKWCQTVPRSHHIAQPPANLCVRA